MYINSSSVFVALVTQICDLISRVTAMFETQYVITVVVKKNVKLGFTVQALILRVWPPQTPTIWTLVLFKSRRILFNWHTADGLFKSCTKRQQLPIISQLQHITWSIFKRKSRPDPDKNHFRFIWAQFERCAHIHRDWRPVSDSNYFSNTVQNELCKEWVTFSKSTLGH